MIFPLQDRTGSVLKYLNEGNFRNCWFKIEEITGIKTGEELSKYYGMVVMNGYPYFYKCYEVNFFMIIVN